MARKSDINIKIGADLKDFSTSMQNVSRTLKRTGKKMQTLGKSLTRSVTLPLALIGAASVKFASDLQESVNKSDVAFGKFSGTVKDFAKTTLDAFGIAEGSSLDMAATFGDMATSMGISQGSAADMSKTLVGLAGDLASFKNIGISQAQTALNAIFTGETESLKLLGIVMTQANLKAFALSKGLDGNIQKMTEAQKVNLRYAFILDKTTNAQGDFIRTGGGAANQMRIFQETLKELSAEFGNVILPAFTKIIKKVNVFIKSIRDISPEFKEAIIKVALFVAAIGPLIAIAGTLISSIGAISGALATMTAVVGVISVPILGVVAAIGLLVAAFTLWKGASTEQIKQTNKHAIAAKKEVSQIRALETVIVDETISRKNRLKAISDLRAIMPKALENLSDEAILSGKAADAIDRQAKSIINLAVARGRQAAAQAIGNEIGKQELSIFERQLEIAKLIARARSFSSDMSREEASNLELQATRLGDLNVASEEQIKLLKEKLKLFGKFIDFDNVSATGTDPTTTGAKGKATGAKGKKESFGLETAFVSGLLVNLEDLKTKTVEYKTILGQFQETSEKIQEKSTLQQFFTDLKDTVVDVSSAIADAVQGLVNDVFVGLGESIGNALNKSEDAVGSFGENILLSISNFMSSLGKMLIATAAASIAFDAILANPLAALAAGVALVALGKATKNQFEKSSQHFAEGGVVMGPSGRDKVPAMLTAGEVVLNAAQQKNLAGQIGGGGGTLTTLLMGNNIKIALERTDKGNSRTR